MRRRSTVRAQADLPVDVLADGYVFPCRAVDISTDGAVIERAAGLVHHEARLLYWLRFHVKNEPVLVLARPAWRHGKSQAFRFVQIDDLGRLSLAEAMDASAKSGLALH